jgi:hypothetical protein
MTDRDHGFVVTAIRSLPTHEERDEAMVKYAASSGCDVRRLLAEINGRAPVSSLLSRETPWPGPLNPAALHGPAGRFVETVAPHSEADPAALLGLYLVTAGALVGPGPHVRIESTAHHPRLFVAIVGRTAKARKGTAADRVADVARRASPEFDRITIDGLGSGEAVVHRLRDRVVNEDGEVVDPGIADKRLLVMEAELARVFAVMDRKGSILSPILRCAWDSGRLHNTTKHSSETATGSHVVVVGMITARELSIAMKSVDTANGFANRFLYVAAERSRLLPFGGDLRDEQLVELGRELAGSIEYARGVGEVRFDPAARELWAEIYGQLSEPRPGVVGDVTARAEAQVLRLALTYALLGRSREIGPDDLAAAAAVWDRSVASVEHLFAGRVGNALAEKLLAALRRSPDGMTRTELHAAARRHVTADELDEALDLLLRTGLVVRDEQPTKGRPREVWRLRDGEDTN